MPRYRATQPIYVGWALAHDTGDPVHEQNVEANGWLEAGLVEEIPDEPLPPAAPAVFVEPSANAEDQPEAPRDVPTEDAPPEPSDKPATGRRIKQ